MILVICELSGREETNMKNIFRNEKALSPVVAAIILIAVTVAVSIAVSAWMGSLATNSMEVSELTIIDLDFTFGDASTGEIAVQVSNPGTSDVTVSRIRVNGEESTSWLVDNSTTVVSGSNETFTIIQLIEAGKKYSVTLYTNDGTMVGSYTATA